jgi:hypothetical protein
MTEYKPRLFASDAAIIDVGEGLLARTLPRPLWTHEAHLAACLWIVRERIDLAPERELPGIIRSYNESVGGVNDDTQGYHETITQFSIAAIRAYLSHRPEGEPLVQSVNALLLSPYGARDLPLKFYSHERLFSVEARRKFIAPDMQELCELANMG